VPGHPDKAALPAASRRIRVGSLPIIAVRPPLEALDVLLADEAVRAAPLMV
jgi:hypothetical protein